MMPFLRFPPGRLASPGWLLLSALAFGSGVPSSSPASTPSNPVLGADPAPVPPGDITVTRIETGPAQNGCTRVYDNTVNFSGSFYSYQNGNETLDDLHGVEGGGLCEFVFGYNEPGSSPISAWVTFYFNDGGDDPPGAVLAGPYYASGLPTGANMIQVTVPGAPPISPSVWMGVRFSSSTAGLLLADPPVVGSSHDFYFENGDYFFFGGDPKANFYLSLEAELAVPVEHSSWGLLKALHP